MTEQKPYKMPVDLVGDDTDHPDIKATFERIKQRNPVANVQRVIANASDVFLPYIGYVHGLRNQTLLDAGLRELAILAVLEWQSAGYEIQHHQVLAKASGCTDDEIQSVSNPEADCFDEQKRAILRFARMFAADPGNRGAMPVGRVEDYLSSRERVELGLTLAVYKGMSHFTTMIDIPEDQADSAAGKLPS